MTDPDARDLHDRGLAFDLATLRTRRTALKVLAGAGLAALVGCASSGDDTASSTTTTAAGGAPVPPGGGPGGPPPDASDASGGGSDDGTIPEETAGPYPGDGSNGPDALGQDGIVRSDIRSSFGDASGTAEGVDLDLRLTVLDGAGSTTPLVGAAVYVWHCSREGGYSMYSEGVAEENFLRGVQEADADGVVRFTTIFPGCYAGRWPHVHFEVYESVDAATGGGDPLATSQLALPADACDAVYATEGYEASVSNLSGVSLDADNVFGDGYDDQLATLSGDVSSGYLAELPVPV